MGLLYKDGGPDTEIDIKSSIKFLQLSASQVLFFLAELQHSWKRTGRGGDGGKGGYVPIAVYSLHANQFLLLVEINKKAPLVAAVVLDIEGTTTSMYVFYFFAKLLHSPLIL